MPTLKTDQFMPTDAQNAATSRQMHEFLDSTKTTCIAVVSAFLIIILFIVGPFKPNDASGSGSVLLMVIRISVACILIYGLIINCGAIVNIYEIKGLFTLNAMSDIRRNFFFSIVFTILIAVLAMLLIYKHFV
jgi:hypothetical protein